MQPCPELRRLQDVIRLQAKTIEQLTEEVRDLDALSCSHTNAAMKALDHLGEGQVVRQAQEVDRFLKIDHVGLLCEIVMSTPKAQFDKRAYPRRLTEEQIDEAAKDRAANEKLLRQKESDHDTLGDNK